MKRAVSGLRPFFVFRKVRMPFRVQNVTRGTCLGESIDSAETSATRSTGLLKHSSLAAGTEPWIVPCESVYLFFMKFANRSGLYGFGSRG